MAGRGSLDGVLSNMRDPSGGPNTRMRLLALLVALLLAGPVAAYLLQGAAQLLSPGP